MLSLLFVALLGCNGEPPGECAESAMITVYVDNDNDGHGVEGTAKQVCRVTRGFAVESDDCDDTRGNVSPTAIEECDGIDNDCDELADEGLREEIFYLDADGDGFGDPDLDVSDTACAPAPGYVDNKTDCDDDNAGINPEAAEICDLGVDNNCNELADDNDPGLDLTSAQTWYFDDDGDTWGGTDTIIVQCQQPGSGAVLNGDDCDDDNVDIFPGAGEFCNGIDDDCDQLIDDSNPDIDPASLTTWYADYDGDGYGDPNSTTDTCIVPWFYTNNADDCDDAEPLLGLPAPWLLDSDGDGYGAGPPSADSCTAPGTDYELQAKGVDCEPADPFSYPGAPEVCDGGVDNDCDGLADDQDPDLDPAGANDFYFDNDLDGYGNPNNSVSACQRPGGYVVDNTDCNDARDDINPGMPEICNFPPIDDDCNLLADDYDPGVDPGTQQTYFADFDSDTFGDPSISQDSCQPPAMYVDNNLDCDDSDPLQLLFGPWVLDGDGDGVGAGVPSADRCDAPDLYYVPTYYGLDCDDNDPDRYPGATEICNNGVDEDCDLFDPPCTPPPEGNCGLEVVAGGEILDGLVPELDYTCLDAPLLKVRLDPGEALDLERLADALSTDVASVTRDCADPELCPVYVSEDPELKAGDWGPKELFIQLGR